MTLEANCHCGNVKLVARHVPDSITSCNCSICHRLGALWAYYPATDVEVSVASDSLDSYLWGEKTMEYHRCRDCGCTTHYTTIEDDGTALIAINTRMVNPQVTGSIEVKHFDGAVSWRYLDD